MRVSRRLWKVAFVSLFCFGLSTGVRAQSQDMDQALAERVLGPQWKQLSRRAGMIFAGTVLFRFADNGTRMGAVSAHRPLTGGQKVLLFLYPLSRLGLTSPVGGARGVIVLDAGGEYVAREELDRRDGLASRTVWPVATSGAPQRASMEQLERAIRSARED